MSIAAANSYISVHKIVISSVLCSYSNLLYGSVHVDIIMYNYKCQFFGIRHDYQLDKSIWASQVYFFKNAIILWHKVLTAIRKIGLLVCESVFFYFVVNCIYAFVCRVLWMPKVNSCETPSLDVCHRTIHSYL